jgi:phthalate 4,5-dioxygenase
MDDSHTMFVSLSWPGSPPSMRPLKNGQMVPGARLGFEYLPNTTDWFGRWRLAGNAANDWLIDREAQRNGGIYTGITGIQAQDQAVTESMGGITDHAFENLAPSDLMIARTPAAPIARRPRPRQGRHRSALRRRAGDLHCSTQRGLRDRHKDRLARRL